jgi:hypothetical protein
VRNTGCRIVGIAWVLAAACSGTPRSAGHGTSVPTRIGTDCSPVSIEGQLVVTACTRVVGDDISLTIEVGGPDGRLELRDQLSVPAIGAPPDHIRIEGANARWLAIAYEGFECSRVQVIDRRGWRIALDTGCWHAGYYSVAGLPSADGCRLTLASGEGDNNPVIRPPYTYDLCGEGVELGKPRDPDD